jgi:hypothetical protein
MDPREIVTGEVRATWAEVVHVGPERAIAVNIDGIPLRARLDHVQSHSLVSRPMWGDQ